MPWQIMRHITLPLLKRVLMFVVVTQTIFSFQNFFLEFVSNPLMLKIKGSKKLNRKTNIFTFRDKIPCFLSNIRVHLKSVK